MEMQEKDIVYVSDYMYDRKKQHAVIRH